jgi:glutamate transport system permease protein
MSTQTVLFDELGPRGKKRVRIGTYIGALLVAILIALAGLQLYNEGQLEPERWEILINPDSGVPQGLTRALFATLRVALIAMVISTILGTLLSAGRLSEHRWVRIPTTFIVQFFRGIPLLLLIFFSYLALPRLGISLDLFWTLIVGLTAYNMAVLGEIFRAGILSIDKGQSEAAYAIGMRKSQVMVFVLVPQAVRRMLPAIVSQLVTLLKDTSLGFVIGYFELLRQGRAYVDYFGAKFGLQIYVAVALFYILTNLALSSFARWLEKRSRSNPKATKALD